MDLSLFLSLCFIALFASAFTMVDAQEVPYGIGEWPANYGDQRARIHVSEKTDAIRVHLTWRRRDQAPELKRILIRDAKTGEAIKNAASIEANREFCDLAFQPETAPGDYDVYYLSPEITGWEYLPVVSYQKPESEADPAWLKRNHLSPELIGDGYWKSLPEAKTLEFQARGAFHRFDPMEIIATAHETSELSSRHAKEPFLLFPEDRDHPIRMTEDLPKRWIESGPSANFVGDARRGEFYAFQVGVWAAHQPLDDISVRFEKLTDESGDALPATASRCFNLGGIDWLGRPFKKKVEVDQGKIAALWFGVQIPADAHPGMYQGTLAIRSKNAPARQVKLTLRVANDIALDNGDDDPFKMSRLRWLDSKIGLDDEPVEPYTPLIINGKTVECLGRKVTFDTTGFPASIRSGDQEILTRPVSFVAETSDGVVNWRSERTRTIRRASGAVYRESISSSDAFELRCRYAMEADGYLNYKVTVAARRDADLKDLRLEIPIRREIATYMMGLGRKGGYRPSDWSWKWDIDLANNSVWLGDVTAGLRCKLNGEEDSWDLYNLRAHGLPKSWDNGGKGGCSVSEEGAETVLVRAFSGPRALKKGEIASFTFSLLITPLKPLNPAHWSQRYYHAYVPPETAVESGANIINIHQGNPLNPYINYPFLKTESLKAYVKEAHRLGVKVKIYYTVRELSDYAAEIWPLRSLGTEIFTDGPGGGDPWLQEHLGDHYLPAWRTPFPDGEADAAIATQGLSRWHNYYLEGLRWLLTNVQIDGLYLDGIGYDREIMKRVRKVMDRTRPGSLIDFHSGSHFHPQYGMSSCANLYMEHFPYIDSLWFGEGFDYNESPDYWLVEVSGLPFGLYGEMLQDNGNPWRGMIYGMTARYYSGADPGPIWKLWDDFGIKDARMLGYWSPEVPVKTDSPDILATAYVKPNQILISLASWAKERKLCHLSIDWHRIGMNPAQARLRAPAIKDFQPEASFSPTDEIPVEPGRGWLLLLDAPVDSRSE